MSLLTPSVSAQDSSDLESVPKEQGAAQLEDKPELIPTGIFADIPSFFNARLSPNGEKLSVLRRSNGQNQFLISSVKTGQTLSSFFLPDGFDARTYRWLNDDLLLITAIGVVETERYYYRVRRMFVASHTGSTIRNLIPDPFISSYAEVVHVFDGGNHVLISHLHHPNADHPSVYRYRLDAEETPQFIHPPIDGVTSWYADRSGNLRLGIGRKGDKVQAWFRSWESSEFELIAEFKDGARDNVFEPVRIDAGSNRGLVLDEGEGSRVGLHEIDFQTGSLLKTIYEVQGWDVDQVWMDDGEPIAAIHTEHTRKIGWLDSQLASLDTELKKALGNERAQFWISSRSRNSERMLITVGNEADPGVLYLFDRQTMSMREIAQFRPALDHTLLSASRPISFLARDGVSINGYLTLPRSRAEQDLPLIIMPHGGPFGVRDWMRYDDWVQLLANRGYAILQPNYRGSGGYGDDFYDLGIGEVGRKMQNDLDDAMDWAVAAGIADPSRVCIVGGSYGGYAALWGVIRNPERYRCAASWAGVTDWPTMLRYDRKYLTRRVQRRWRKQIEGDPDFDMKEISPYRRAREISRPVLLVHGSRDRNVPLRQFERMKRASEKAGVRPTTLIVHGEGHSFSEKRYKIQWLRALDEFLAEHNPADQLDEAGNLTVPPDPRLNSFFKPLVIEKQGQ